MGEHAPTPDRDLGLVDQTSQQRPARAGEPHALGHVAHSPKPGEHKLQARAAETGTRRGHAEELIIFNGCHTDLRDLLESAP
ncbi:MAG TPA: hypothetical protein VGW74_19630 [Propionibacteriaceae bacterium]|nr:hypothetical protein [Propionibacteriaceae bacterium]